MKISEVKALPNIGEILLLQGQDLLAICLISANKVTVPFKALIEGLVFFVSLIKHTWSDLLLHVHQYKEQQENLGIVEFKARGEIITSVALEPNIVFIEPIFKILHFISS